MLTTLLTVFLTRNIQEVTDYGLSLIMMATLLPVNASHVGYLLTTLR